METNRLKHFCRVYETESISKAAELTGITKSGLSRSLRILQDELGIELITTVGRGIGITDAGNAFYHKAQEILRDIDKLKNIELQSTSLKFGALELLNYNLLPTALANPKFNTYDNMLLLDLVPGDLEQEVSSGKLDWGFTYIPTPVHGVEHLALAKFSVSAYGTELYTKSLKQGTKLSFVLSSDSPPMTPTGDKQQKNWIKHTSNVTKAITVNRLSSGMAFALDSKIAIFLPEFLVKIHNSKANPTTQLFEIKDHVISDTKRTLYLIKKKGKSENKDIKAICSIIRSCITQN